MICRRFTRAVLPVLVALALAACVGEQARDAAASSPMLQPAASIRAETLAPGLAVRYWPVMIRDLREFGGWRDRVASFAGAPLVHLDHVMGEGPVLTSGTSDGVVAEITGFVRLDAPGRYVFSAVSNDGIRATLGGAVIAEDPDVHADRASPPRAITVASAGWYPLHVLYFERRNTATLRLLWQPPGAPALAPIPAQALRHPLP